MKFDRKTNAGNEQPKKFPACCQYYHANDNVEYDKYQMLIIHYEFLKALRSSGGIGGHLRLEFKLANQGGMIGKLDLRNLKIRDCYLRAVKNVIELSTGSPAGVGGLSVAVRIF